jgi:hypothetical protein
MFSTNAVGECFANVFDGINYVVGIMIPIAIGRNYAVGITQ